MQIYMYQPTLLLVRTSLVCYMVAHTAYAVSSNYNFLPGLSSGFEPIQHALQMIQAEGSKYSELEVDLVEAMATRSSAESKAAMDPTHMNFGERVESCKPYGRA